MTAITEQTGWVSLGVLPWFAEAWKLPAEDVMDIATRAGGAIKIAVPRLARISNFDDLDPLVAEPNVTVEIVEQGQPLPGDASLVILPGSKSTISDLENFRANGWDIDLQAHHRRGGHIIGICGGYQMLGRKVHDPDGIEGAPRSIDGLGYLDIETTMVPKKNLSLTEAAAPKPTRRSAVMKSISARAAERIAKTHGSSSQIVMRGRSPLMAWCADAICMAFLPLTAFALRS